MKYIVSLLVALMLSISAPAAISAESDMTKLIFKIENSTPRELISQEKGPKDMGNRGVQTSLSVIHVNAMKYTINVLYWKKGLPGDHSYCENGREFTVNYHPTSIVINDDDFLSKGMFVICEGGEVKQFSPPQSTEPRLYYLDFDPPTKRPDITRAAAEAEVAKHMAVIRSVYQ